MKEAPNSAADAQEKLRIFLSYKREDEDRAKQLETALRAAGQGRIDVFRDRQIPFGEDWREKITEHIANSDLLLLLYTDPLTKDWGWCLFECGMFLRNTKDVDNTLLCLHHPSVEPPGPVRHLQSVTATDRNAHKLLRFLLVDYPERHKMRPINLDLLVESENRQQLDLYCEQIVKAAGEATAQLDVHGARLEINVHPDDILISAESHGRERYEIAPEVCVEVSVPLAACLGFDHTDLTWGSLRKSCISDKRWLEALARVIYRFVQQGDTSLRDEAMLEMFRSDRDARLYRPYLHQIEKGADGRIRFFVYFMEESSLDYRCLPSEFGMLFTGLTLGTRFRYEILKKYKGRVHRHVLRERDCGKVLEGIWRQIAKIEQESTARGINNPGLLPFAYGEYGNEIRAMFTEWDGMRPQLVQIAAACETCIANNKQGDIMLCDRLNEMEKLLEGPWNMNSRFMFLTSSCVHAVINKDVGLA